MYFLHKMRIFHCHVSLVYRRVLRCLEKVKKGFLPNGGESMEILPWVESVKNINLNKSKPISIQSCSQMMIGLFNHLFSMVFKFYNHSRKVIGSKGLFTDNTFTYKKNI